MSSAWKNHQLKSIASAVKNSGGRPADADTPQIEPLFPGSYLCNQIVFLEPGSVGAGCKINAGNGDASLNIIYQSLSCSGPNAFEPYILIDGADLDEVTKPLLFDAIHQHISSVATLLVLDQSMQREINKLFNTTQLKVHRVNPEWSNAADVLSLYRNAQHCVFIDNHRVMDAAVCDCPLTLISSSTFARQLSTNALWQCLESRSNCYLTGALAATSESSKVTVVENNLHDFQQMLKGDAIAEYTDWLDEYRTIPGHSPAVIERYLSVWHVPTRNLLDLRLSVRRKALKLAEDPKRFCGDSRNPVLKQLGKLIPSREAT